MPRPKGTPKTGGRKKGTPNKTTAQLKSWVFNFVSENLEQFEAEFNKLDKETQVSIVLKLMPYVLPKQTETKHSVDEESAINITESIKKLEELFS